MDNQETNKYLGEEKISKILFKFAIPCILSLLISSLYNIVDQIFIGHSELGYLGNAATSVVFPITIILVAFAWCFGDGSAAFLSLAQGRKDTKNVHVSIGNSILVNFIISILFIIFGFIFMESLLRMFGALLASLVQVLLPRNILMVFNNNQVLSIVVLMLFAYLISLCSTSDSFVGKSLLSTFNERSIIAYLLLGPMIDIKNTIVLLGNYIKSFVWTLISLIFIVIFIFSLLVVKIL